MRIGILKSVFLMWLLLIFQFLPFSSVSAHRFHTSLTVMDYNSEEKLVEITIQLFTQDLAEVLEKKYNKRIFLEKKETDDLIFEYLRENFNLFSDKSNTVKINWVGKEIEVDKCYVYMEIPLDESLEGKKLQNTIFFESYNEQTNLVVLKFDKKKTDLLFKVGDKLKEIQVGSHKG